MNSIVGRKDSKTIILELSQDKCRQRHLLLAQLANPGGRYIKWDDQDKPLIIKYFIIIDPDNGWFEIVQYNDKQADTIANLVE